MKRVAQTCGRIVRAAVLLALLLCAPAALAQGDDNTLVIHDRQGSIATTSQNIVVEGTVRGDVTSWSGNITVNGRVTGDVISYTGQISIASGGQVEGNVLALDGGLEQAASATIGGQTLGNMGEGGALGNLLDLFTPRASQPRSGAEVLGRTLLGLVLGVLVLAFCTVWAALWPRRTGAAALTLRRLPARALLLGLLTTLLAALALLPLTALLGATVIGLPLIALLLLALHLPYIYGLAALVLALGATGEGALLADNRLNRRAIGVAVALAVLVVLVSLARPVGGLALVYLLGSPGLGAVILCRGGMALPQPA